MLKIELNGENAGQANGLNIVGGTNSEVKGLVINRFALAGIGIGNNVVNTAVVKVEGNFIGTDPSGATDLGNASGGVNIFGQGTVGNVVGGLARDTRNVISGNGAEGVRIGLGKENRVEGNFIGTEKDGTGALSNDGAGVFIQDSSDNAVGIFSSVPAPVAGPGANTIAFNEEDGVGIGGDDSTGNHVLSNSIFSNVDPGIDLGDDGPAANDEDDPDGGPNNGQNFPVLASASPFAVQGSLNSTPSTTFRIEFFANDECDPSGNGKTFSGSTDVTTDAGGDASFSETFFSSPPGSFVTATATRVDVSSGFAIPKDTSEFSACREISDNFPPEALDDAYTANAGQTLVVNAANGVLKNDTDPDGDALEAQLDIEPSNGQVTLDDDGSFTYTPNLGFSGADSFQYTPNDGDLNGNRATVTIEVRPVDEQQPPKHKKHHKKKHKKGKGGGNGGGGIHQNL